jgi:hypothetical protein
MASCAAAAVPALDEVDALALAARHAGIAQAVGRVAVHQHLAGDEGHAAAFGTGKQRLGRDRVHGGKDRGRGRAVGQQRVEEMLAAGRGHGGVGPGSFGREGVALEPFEQRRAVTGQHGDLRRVHVGVDEARQQQPARVHLARHAGGWGLGLDGGDAAVGADQEPVRRAPADRGALRVAPGGAGGEVEQVGLDGAHWRQS